MTFASLKKQVALGLNVGLAGIPLWGTDIGGFGFGGKCTAELYARWFQFGAFCPLFRPHGDQTQLREPWQFGPEIEAICRKYLQVRYRLLPYIYSALHDACTSGSPLMRALVSDFQQDPEVHNLGDEFLFGRDILVAPILSEGASSRSVYLPAGAWIDFWTDEIHFGPCRMTVRAELDTIPLFVRQGAIIPTGPDVQYSWERPLDPLTLEIYPGADCSFDLYEDDGETNSYQNGAYAETRFRIWEDRNSLFCHLGSTRGGFAGFRPERTIFLNIHRQLRAGSVHCDDVAVPALATADLLGKAQFGCWWEEQKRILSVKLQGAKIDRVVRVSQHGFTAQGSPP
jgi:alpha-glucosidase (family GH31 glycosyl hydrolase)